MRDTNLLEEENKRLRLEVAKLEFMLDQQTSLARKKTSEADHDFLTGVYNRSSFTKFVNSYLKEKKLFSVIFVDLDNFKQVNDRFSHQDGDKVLVEVAEVLLKSNRAESIVGRLGGEEFAVLVPEVKEDICFKVAERIRKNIEEIQFDIDIKVTASIGIYTAKKTDDIDIIIHRADKAMYYSKHSGKNKVTKYSQLK